MCPFSFWSALSSMYILRPSLSRLSRGGFGFNFDCLLVWIVFRCALGCCLIKEKEKEKGNGKRKRTSNGQGKRDKEGEREKERTGRTGKRKQKRKKSQQKPKANARPKATEATNRSHQKPKPTEAKSQHKPPRANRSHQKFTERVGTLIGICVLRLNRDVYYWWSVWFSMGKALQSRDFV